MFPTRYFAAAYFAPRYFPRQGLVDAVIRRLGQLVRLVGVDRRVAALRGVRN